MTQKENNHQTEPADFHGAAIIDQSGQEVPITEDMVVHACEDLDQSRLDTPKEKAAKESG